MTFAPLAVSWRARALQCLLRAIPDFLPGKTRISAWLVHGCRLRGPLIVNDRFGNRLCVPNANEPIALHLLARGVYEPDTLKVLLDWLPARGGLFLDVGANVGALTLAVAAQRPHSRVVSVEGSPQIVDVLAGNVRMNARTNVQVVATLAGDSEADVTFYRAPEEHFGMGSLGPQFGPEFAVTLKQRPLCTVLHELRIPRVDVVKLDIEGAEVGALRGLLPLLRGEEAPVVVMEFCDWAEVRISGQTCGDAQRLLLHAGYALFQLSQRGGELHQPLKEPLLHGTAMILALPPRARSEQAIGRRTQVATP